MYISVFLEWVGRPGSKACVVPHVQLQSTMTHSVAPLYNIELILTHHFSLETSIDSAPSTLRLNDGKPSLSDAYIH